MTLLNPIKTACDYKSATVLNKVYTSEAITIDKSFAFNKKLLEVGQALMNFAFYQRLEDALIKLELTKEYLTSKDIIEQLKEPTIFDVIENKCDLNFFIFKHQDLSWLIIFTPLLEAFPMFIPVEVLTGTYESMAIIANYKDILNVDTIVESSNRYNRFNEAKEKLYEVFNIIEPINIAYFQERTVKPLIAQLTINNFFINMCRYLYHKITSAEQKERSIWNALIKSTNNINIV